MIGDGLLESQLVCIQPAVFKIYEKSLRLFVAPFIFMYGLAKPWQFENAFAGTATPVNELDGMSLMWSFFGYSLIVPVVIGIFECVGAALLLFDRTKLFGSLLLLPVLANVVLFDLVYGVVPFATMNGIIYLAVVLFVCGEQRERLSEAFRILLCPTTLDESTKKLSLHRILVMFGFLILNGILFLAMQQLGQGLLLR